ncbi:dipeptidyl-peptidase-like protein V precursor [Xylariaceae sp. FL1019]|nr:dipeptidyl-peptidase-like protein V precursor [Xylariaceae sp. FL1019]
MAVKAAKVLAALALPLAHAYDIKGMLGAPRRSAALVNPSGKLALFSSVSYDWTEQAASTTWQLMDVKTGSITEAPFDSAVSEVVWVGPTDTSILYINGTNDDIPGGVTLYIADISLSEFSPKLVASLAAPFQGLKAVQTKNGGINYVVNALSHWNNGSAYNPEFASTPLSSGVVYDSNWIRHWDTYVTPERYAVFGGSIAPRNGSYAVNSQPKNLIWGINARITRPESPVQPFGDAGDYDISPDGKTVAFLTKAPELPKANYTASYIYIVPHDGSEIAVQVNGPGTTAPLQARGASASPRWSPDGTKLAYLQMDGIAYESDRNKLYIAAINGLNSDVSVIAEDWDSTPSGFKWYHDGESIWAISELYSSSRLYVVPVDADSSFVPSNFTGSDTSVADFEILPNGSALVSSASSWTSRMFYTQAPGGEKTVLFTANEVDAELEGLQPKDVSDFWVENDDGIMIQTFMYYPTDFDATKQYPLMFVFHGGPQSSLGDIWSVRWNLRLWAEQGFVVASTQFTGTPSYGQAFTDKITNNWGGTPYTDLVKVFEHLKNNVSFVDTDRAIAGGASFGCYMTNWIQGHDLGREFKGLVCHDGKVNQVGAYMTDELFFIEHDANGTIWNDRANYERWDPLAHAANFSTPELVVHSEGDYRIAISEGLQTFNVLQGRGVPSRFIYFPDESHQITNRANALLWHTHIFNWIRHWAGLEEELIQEGVVHQ